MSKIKEITGMTFGRLTVIKKAKSKNGLVWECECSCPEHTHIFVRGADLRNGHTKSCGCLKRELTSTRRRNDLTSQVFGRLTVLYDTAQRSKDGSIIWKCQCECGNQCDIRSTYLVNGDTKSCGCLNSAGEANIQKILEENHIAYEKQKSFNDLKSISDHKYYYDFYLPDYNRLVEFDGEQHYKSSSGWNSYEHLQKVQERDKIKNNYAFQENIDLVRIPYCERDNISLELLLGNKYLLKQTDTNEPVG